MSSEVMSIEKEHGKIIKRLEKVLPIEHVSEGFSVRSKGEMGEGTTDAYKTLRMARSDARLVGVREKRAKAKAEESQAAKK